MRIEAPKSAEILEIDPCITKRVVQIPGADFESTKKIENEYRKIQHKDYTPYTTKEMYDNKFSDILLEIHEYIGVIEEGEVHNREKRWKDTADLYRDMWDFSWLFAEGSVLGPKPKEKDDIFEKTYFICANNNRKTIKQGE